MNLNTLEFILEHESDDLQKLALQGNLYPDVDLPFVLQQIKGRKIAKEKIPHWYSHPEILYPQHLSLEQSSSEATAKYKASLFKGSILIDLTGGLGVDFSFLSPQFQKSVYVEAQSHLSELAKHNFEVLQLKNYEIVNADGVEYLKVMENVDTIYIDPARRDDKGRKTVSIQDCTPNIVDIQDLLDSKAERTIIKLSPMLDISLALESLTHVSNIYVISHRNECKELLFVKEKNVSSAPQIHCINILSDNKIAAFSFTKEEESAANCEYTSNIESYLYEPNASLLKAGTYKSISQYYGLKKLHPNSNLYTSSQIIVDFPGRKFRVTDLFSLNKKDVKTITNKVEKANISVRNFPLKAEELRKRLKLNDGGNAYIFATTLFDEKKVIILTEKFED